MSDGITLNPGSGGKTVDTEELENGRQVEKIQLATIADGVATPISEANPLPIRLTGSIPGVGGLFVSPATAVAMLSNAFAWNETHGMAFYNYIPVTVTGVRFATGPSGAGKTFKATLWSPAGAVLATKSIVASADNVAETITFDAPVTLALPTSANDRYSVSIKCTSDSYVVLGNHGMSTSPGGGSWVNVNSWPFILRTNVLFVSFCWTGGDAYPSTPTTSYMAGCEPVFA